MAKDTKSKKGSSAKKGETPAEPAKTPNTVNPAPTASSRGGTATPGTSVSKESLDAVKAVEEQAEEVREQVLSRAPAGTATATGKALAEEEEEERVDNLENRGAKEEPEDAPDEGDFLGDPPKLSKAQKAKAHMTASGTKNPRMVASPSGPVPVSTVARSPEAAEERLKHQRASELDSVRSRLGDEVEEIPAAKIRSMSGAEARAILADRGYMQAHESNAMSNRGARAALLKAQEEDDRVKKSKK